MFGCCSVKIAQIRFHITFLNTFECCFMVYNF